MCIRLVFIGFKEIINDNSDDDNDNNRNKRYEVWREMGWGVLKGVGGR